MGLTMLGLAACGGSTPAAESPDPLGAGLTPFERAPEAHDEPAPLPRYFAVELDGEGVVAMGNQVTREELAALAAREADDTRNLGVAVAVTGAVARQQVSEVVNLLLDAGFAHLVLSSRDGMLTKLAASSRSNADVPETEPSGAFEIEESEAEVSTSPQVAEEPALLEIPDDVEVVKMGMHIGGGPNTEEAHAVYSDPIFERFDEFKRCYPLAQGPRRNSSFGVDLLVSTKGGSAKIKDYRTALGGKDFHLCVLGVFGTIEFPAPERATVVSYSLLFKPL